MCELHLLETRKDGKGRATRTALHSASFPAAPLPALETRQESHRTYPGGAGGAGAAAARTAAPPHAHAGWRGHRPVPQTAGVLPPSCGPRGATCGLWTRCETLLLLPTAAEIPGRPPTLSSCSLYVLSGGNRCPLITSLLLDFSR